VPCRATGNRHIPNTETERGEGRTEPQKQQNRPWQVGLVHLGTRPERRLTLKAYSTSRLPQSRRRYERTRGWGTGYGSATGCRSGPLRRGKRQPREKLGRASNRSDTPMLGGGNSVITQQGDPRQTRPALVCSPQLRHQATALVITTRRRPSRTPCQSPKKRLGLGSDPVEKTRHRRGV
jgi:hypothetical protein